MSLESLAISVTDDLPIRHKGDVHSGKVRSVYWLNEDDSVRIAKDFDIPDKELGVMVISDRISAYECKWQSEGGLKGVPGKGAALNAISKYWLDEFEKNDLAGNHVLATPHPLVWVVRKAEPVMVEAIARQYITGSMWRAYNDKNAREFCGIQLPEGLKQNQKLDSLLITPTTKGILKGLPGVPEDDDADITRINILDNYSGFGFKSIEHVTMYEDLLIDGFNLISDNLARLGKVFVDTKFEFGYIKDEEAGFKLIYIDEIGTPDSSRYWDSGLYKIGKTKEESKELFREKLLEGVPDRTLLLDKKRQDERVEFAKTYRVKDRDMIEVSALYKRLAKEITGKDVPTTDDVKVEILDSLAPYGIVK